MEQYYIATAEGKTEGPYSFENLEVQCNCGIISPETLVCVAGGQEWKEFKTILSQKGKGAPDLHKVEEVRKNYMILPGLHRQRNLKRQILHKNL